MTANRTMTNLQTVDRLEVLVVVDNVTDSLSTNPNNVQTEWAGLLQSGRMQVLSGKATCCAHHGLSVLITAYVGSEKRTSQYRRQDTHFLKVGLLSQSVMCDASVYCLGFAAAVEGFLVIFFMGLFNSTRITS